MRASLFLVSVTALWISSQGLFAASNEALYNKYWNQGAQYSDQGEWQKAATAFTRAIKYYPTLPDNFGTYINRGNAYSMLGKLDLALSDYNKALASFDDKSTTQAGEIYYNRGAAYHKNGKPNLAIPDYEQAIAIDPKIPDVHNKLAWLLATSPDDQIRNGKGAVAYALIANKRFDFKRPGHLDTLAAAYAESGDFDNAIKTQKLAISLLDEADAIEDYDVRLKLYEASKPYHARD